MIERDGELHRFLHRDVASEEALSIILFLYKHRDRGWTPAELREKLNIEPASIAPAVVVKRVELRLQDLWQRGLVQRSVDDGLYRCGTTDMRQKQDLEQISALADGDLQDAIKLMYVRPRTGAEAFANAFGRWQDRS